MEVCRNDEQTRRDDECGGSGKVKRGNERCGTSEAQGAINLQSCRTDVAVNATEKRMNFGWFVGSYGETRGVATTKIIETRPVRELNTLKGEMAKQQKGTRLTDGLERR